METSDQIHIDQVHVISPAANAQSCDLPYSLHLDNITTSSFFITTHLTKLALKCGPRSVNQCFCSFQLRSRQTLASQDDVQKTSYQDSNPRIFGRAMRPTRSTSPPPDTTNHKPNHFWSTSLSTNPRDDVQT
jgi:hypothetical protein